VLPAQHRLGIDPPQHLAKQAPVQMPLGQQSPAARKMSVRRNFLSNGLAFGIWYEFVTNASNRKQVERL